MLTCELNRFINFNLYSQLNLRISSRGLGTTTMPDYHLQYVSPNYLDSNQSAIQAAFRCAIEMYSNEEPHRHRRHYHGNEV
jgi:hypothetical protein